MKKGDPPTNLCSFWRVFDPPESSEEDFRVAPLMEVFKYPGKLARANDIGLVSILQDDGRILTSDISGFFDRAPLTENLFTLIQGDYLTLNHWKHLLTLKNSTSLLVRPWSDPKLLVRLR